MLPKRACTQFKLRLQRAAKAQCFGEIQAQYSGKMRAFTFTPMDVFFCPFRIAMQLTWFHDFRSVLPQPSFTRHLSFAGDTTSTI